MSDPKKFISSNKTNENWLKELPPTMPAKKFFFSKLPYSIGTFFESSGYQYRDLYKFKIVLLNDDQRDAILKFYNRPIDKMYVHAPDLKGITVIGRLMKTAKADNLDDVLEFRIISSLNTKYNAVERYFDRPNNPIKIQVRWFYICDLMNVQLLSPPTSKESEAVRRGIAEYLSVVDKYKLRELTESQRRQFFKDNPNILTQSERDEFEEDLQKEEEKIREMEKKYLEAIPLWSES